MLRLNVNGRSYELDDEVDPATPLLWVLRDHLGLVGTKYGCGIGLCSACAVHLDGAPVQSCQLPVETVAEREITTIEGLAAADGTLTPVQQAWIDEDVPQCGYCQAGQIMRATALLATNPNPSDAEIDSGMAANLCRCGTYNRIRRAVRRAADRLARNVEANETGGAA